jgi:hypothetical protein
MLILILFTLFRMYIQNSTSFSLGKKCSKVCEANNWQMNSRIFAENRLSPTPSPATQTPHLDVGENTAAVRDGLCC